MAMFCESLIQNEQNIQCMHQQYIYEVFFYLLIDSMCECDTFIKTGMSEFIIHTDR